MIGKTIAPRPPRMVLGIAWRGHRGTVALGIDLLERMKIDKIRIAVEGSALSDHPVHFTLVRFRDAALCGAGGEAATTKPSEGRGHLGPLRARELRTNQTERPPPWDGVRRARKRRTPESKPPDQGTPLALSCPK